MEIAVNLIPDGICDDDKQLSVLLLFHIDGMTVTMNAMLFDGDAFYPLPSRDALIFLDNMPVAINPQIQFI